MLMHTKGQDIYQGWSSSTDDKQKKKRAKLVSAFWFVRPPVNDIRSNNATTNVGKFLISGYPY